MFLKRQTPYSTVLSVVCYFTGGYQQGGTFNIFLLLEEFSPYSKRGGGRMCAAAVENCVSYKKGKKHKYLEWITSPLW